MKKLFFPIDIVLFLLLYCVIAVCGLVLYVRSIFLKHKRFETRRILQLVHFGIDDIEREGLSHPVYKTDLSGYFENVVTVLFSYRNLRDIDKRTGVHRIVSIPQQSNNILMKMGLSKTNLGLGAIRLFFRCVKLVCEERISLIRAQDPHILGLAALITSLYTGIPYTIHVIQNYDISTRRVRRMVFPPFIFKWVENRLERIILRNSLFVTTGSINYKFYSIYHGARPEVTFSFRMRADDIHFKEPALRKNLKEQLGLADKHMLLYVGRLERVKFTEDLVLCLKVVSGVIDNATLVIAGDGQLKERLKSLAKELEVEDDVIFLGKLPQERLVNLYYSADVILFAHAGVVLVEAALSGKPIACYDHDWSGEVLGYNARGLLAQFRDVKGMAENVVTFLKNRSLASSVGKAARDFAVKYFNEKTMTEIERSFFDRFLSRNIG